MLMISAAMIMHGRSADNDRKMDRFIDGLMEKMSVEEKIGQLNLPTAPSDIITGPARESDIAGLISKGQIGGLFNISNAAKAREIQELAVNSGHGIPLLFGLDVIHGQKTVFPIPLGLSATWDPDAIERMARISAIEASAMGINWTYSPMVDISHDARWGRVAEGSGEDPYLGSRIAEAYIRGYQGDLTDDDEILACVKHYALYGAADAGRDYTASDMSRYRMFNWYMEPYRAAVDAGAASVMSAFQQVEGVPCALNSFLLQDVLRDRWGFDGFVVADYNAVGEAVNHGMGSLEEVSARALKAGLDMDMVTGGYVGTLGKALKDGLIREEDIDKACRRILEAKYRLGLFDDPYRFCDTENPEEKIFTPEHRAEARKIAAESFVLLKNDGILPLDRKARIDYGKCVGCGQCVAVCQHGGAVVKDWDSSETLNYKIAEYALAVVKDKPAFHINFIMNVSPNCDCWNHNDAAIIPDLGIAASFDPVALDCACADLVKAAPTLEKNVIADLDSKSGDGCGHSHHEGEDKFHIVHPDTRWEAGVEHGEKIGLGNMAYKLIIVK